jgi:hypothetical protein
LSKTRENEVGALWERQKQDGSTYYTGTIGGQKVVVWRNTYKQPGESSPDWRVYRDTREPQQQPAQRERGFAASEGEARRLRRELERQGYDVERATVDRGPKGGRSRDELDDDIPFSAETRV